MTERTINKWHNDDDMMTKVIRELRTIKKTKSTSKSSRVVLDQKSHSAKSSEMLLDTTKESRGFDAVKKEEQNNAKDSTDIT